MHRGYSLLADIAKIPGCFKAVLVIRSVQLCCWSVRELQRQYHSSLYERLALSRDKKGVRTLAKKGQIIESPGDALKNSFVLEFLDLQEGLSYTESELETAIINKLEHFMLELGKGFTYPAKQR